MPDAAVRAISNIARRDHSDTGRRPAGACLRRHTKRLPHERKPVHTAASLFIQFTLFKLYDLRCLIYQDNAFDLIRFQILRFRPHLYDVAGSILRFFLLS